MSEEYTLAYRKGTIVGFGMFLLIISLCMYMILILDTYNSLSKIVGIKGKVDVYMKSDDRGSEITSLLNSERNGTKAIESLSFLGLGSESGIYTDVKSDIEKILDTIYKAYDFTVISPYGTINFRKNLPLSYTESNTIGSCGTVVDVNAKLNLPVDSDKARVTSGFGYRELGGKCDCHGGIDFGVREAEVKVALDGVVDYIGWEDPKDKNKGFGYYIRLKHMNPFGDGKIYYTYYGHLKEGSERVKIRQEVKAGDILAISGNTGKGNSYHLHFELRRADENGNPGIADVDSVDPCPFFPQLKNCEHEPVDVCRRVVHKNVYVVSAEIPLPGANPNALKARVELRRWE